MRIEWFIGLRYLRARSQIRFVSFISLMSIIGVALGVAVLIATLAILTGFSGEIQTKIAGTNAHITVSQFTPFSKFEAVEAVLNEIPDVKGVSPVIEGNVMIGSDFGSAWGLIKGIEPAKEIQVTELDGYMRETKAGRGSPDLLEKPETVPLNGMEGRPETAYLPGIILGSGLASRLLAFQGSVVTVLSTEGGLSTTAGIAPATQRFKVVGIFESGMYEIDRNIAYIHLKDAQIFYDMEGFISNLQLRVTDIAEVDKIENLVMDRLISLQKEDSFRVVSIKERYRNLFWALKLEKVVTVLLLFFIVIVAAFNILASLSMVVMEKSKEIAILKAMGMRNGAVMQVFIIQGVLIGFIGALLGNVLGLGFSWALERYEFVQLPKEVYYITTIPIHIQPTDILLINGISIFLCLIATLWPARSASIKDPVEVLRYE